MCNQLISHFCLTIILFHPVCSTHMKIYRICHFFRWSKWQEATSHTSSASPASSHQTRVRMSVGSSTTAAAWHSTTAFVLTSRWKLTAFSGQVGSNRGRWSSSPRGTFRRAITTQKAGSYWNPWEPPLTVLTAVGCRVHVALRKGCHRHSRHAGLGSTQTSMCSHCYCLGSSAVERLYMAWFCHNYMVFCFCWFYVLCIHLC